jgi:hypothetical protein
MQKLEANAWIAFRFRCETGRFRIASPVKNFTWPPKSLYGHRETSPTGFTFTLLMLPSPCFAGMEKCIRISQINNCGLVWTRGTVIKNRDD